MGLGLKRKDLQAIAQASLMMQNFLSAMIGFPALIILPVTR